GAASRCLNKHERSSQTTNGSGTSLRRVSGFCSGIQTPIYTFCYSKEDRGTQTCPRLLETKHTRQRPELQDRVFCFYTQKNYTKRLHNVSRSKERIYAHPNTQILSHTFTKNKVRKVADNAITVETHFYMDINSRNISLKAPFSKIWGLRQEVTKLLKQFIVIEEDININCNTYRNRQTEPFSIVPPGDPRTGTLYRFQQHCLENSCGLTILLKIVKSLGGVDDELPKTARNCQINTEPLPSNKHAPPALTVAPVEPDIPGSPESAQKTSEDHFDYTSMENSNVKISAVEQQKLAPHGMENQRRVLQVQGLPATAIKLLFSTNEQSSVNPAHIFKAKKLSKNTIKSYKSAILILVTDIKTVKSSPCIKEFLRAIDETKIKSFFSPEIDISLIVLKINEWGDTSGLDNHKLTIKCC
ncbi:hypothetical protein BB561_006891, partial [Smittium simulii]